MKHIFTIIIFACLIFTLLSSCASPETHSEDITEPDAESSFEEQMPANSSAEASALFENIVRDKAYIWDWEGELFKVLLLGQ